MRGEADRVERQRHRRWRCAPPLAPADDVYCAVHGDCCCPRRVDGSRMLSQAGNPRCDLHGPATDHPNGVMVS